MTSLGAVRVEWHAVHPGPRNFNLNHLGLASSVALGLALVRPERTVVCLDGDGSVLANLNTFVTIADRDPDNLVHVIFDNSCHESSGAIPTATARRADLAAIARGAGLDAVAVEDVDAFREALSTAVGDAGPSTIVARVEPANEALEPVPYHFRELTARFMRALQEEGPMPVLDLPLPVHLREKVSDSGPERGGVES